MQRRLAGSSLLWGLKCTHVCISDCTPAYLISLGSFCTVFAPSSVFEQLPEAVVCLWGHSKCCTLEASGLEPFCSIVSFNPEGKEDV